MGDLERREQSTPEEKRRERACGTGGIHFAHQAADARQMQSRKSMSALSDFVSAPR